MFLVTDGMGPTSLSLTRSFRQYRDTLDYDDILTLDKHLIGSSRTRSSDSLVTDSAAGATAFSCSKKTFNNGVAVDSDNKPCGTLLEAMKLQGYHTGLVVTTKITDATPAAFSSHVTYRFYEDLVAQHQLGDYPLGRMVDLMIGGGRAHFYPPTDTKYGTAGVRKDGRNLIDEAINDGWSYVGNRTEFDALKMGKNVELPLLALIADVDIPFDLDRDDSVHPSLEEEAITALNALTEATKDSDKGFFLLIEGSRIDHAGHFNDPAAQVREVLAFDKAFKSVLEYVDGLSTETIVISTSDHETGGLSAARQLTPEYPEYLWKPEALNDAKHSGEYLNIKILNYHGDDLKSFIETEILEKDLGIKDYTEKEVKLLVENKAFTHFILNDIVSKRSQTGWSTHGHSAVDVNIYAHSNKPETLNKLRESLSGNRENTDIGKVMRDFVGVNLDEVSSQIAKTQIKPKGVTVLEEVTDNYFHGKVIHN